MNDTIYLQKELKKNNLLVTDSKAFYTFPSLLRSSINKTISAKLEKKGLNFNYLINEYLQTLNINTYEGAFNCQLIFTTNSTIQVTIYFQDKNIFIIQIPILNTSHLYFQKESDAITIKTHILRALSIDKKTIREYQEWAFNQKFKTNDFFDFMQILIGTNSIESLKYFKKRSSYIS